MNNRSLANPYWVKVSWYRLAIVSLNFHKVLPIGKLAACLLITMLLLGLHEEARARIPIAVSEGSLAELDPITPILECVEDLGNGKFKATFGYENPNGANVTVPQGNSRVVWNGTLRQEKVLNKFKPGLHQSVLEAEFDVSGVEDGLTWIIRIPKKASMEAPADASSTTCEPDISSIENFKAIAVSTTQINLSWDKPAADESFTYTIERSKTGEVPWIEVVSALPQETDSFSDIGLEEFTIYY
jgi:hypothetical protein